MEEVFISEKQIQSRNAELAAELRKNYEGEHVVFICVMNGAIFFFKDLMVATKLHDIRLAYIRAKSYEGTESTGNVVITGDVGDITGKSVVLIEDILDTGKTLTELTTYLEKKNPKSLEICCLLRKKGCQKYDVPVEYVGFDIKNEFVIGYGLDLDEKYRNLPYIAIYKGE